MTDENGDIAGYFDRFVVAFGSFDGKAVGALFVTPGVALTHDGALHGSPRSRMSRPTIKERSTITVRRTARRAVMPICRCSA
jgi:hypothetical protein